MRKFGDEDLGRAASRIWSEGRANPIGWEIRTAVGVFTTDDRTTWRTEAGKWTAELRRSRNGNHWFLAVFEAGVYRGRYDASRWHAATDRKRVRQLRSYQLPLAA
jgi:hypothetical protein